MSFEDRQKASLGPEKLLYCTTCMSEQEVYSAAGHKVNQMNLHCVRCGKFVTRLIKNAIDEWDLDMDVYEK